MSRLSLSEFADRVNEIMPSILREFLKHQSEGFYKIRVTMPQFVVMDILHRRGVSKMTDLAHLLNVTTAAITGIIDRLARDAYVKRLRDPEDRRIIKASLTPKGEGMVRNILKRRKRMMMKIFGMITQEEREEYIKILTHIQNHLKE